MQRKAVQKWDATPEIFLSADADHEHYLNLNPWLWRWRTPSPNQDPKEVIQGSEEGSYSESSEGMTVADRNTTHQTSNMGSRGERFHMPRIEVSFVPSDENVITQVPGFSNAHMGRSVQRQDFACRLSESESEGETTDGCQIRALDTSRIATLTRLCRYGGYFKKVPEGGEVTVGELREMATRQQHQIEAQQKLLVAREQRLKYLKQQEGKAAMVTAEAERLRRLRERVEAQEAKLKRLRALRGQVDSSRHSTASLTSDLDAMRHLFSEKEKELVLAAAKVEELTKQLEDLRSGRSPIPSALDVLGASQNQHHNELDKLRTELLYRNRVNREASSRMACQRETLNSKKDEITRIDKRIAELQQRLHRKRLLNQQLASQISAATQAKQAQLKAVHQKSLREAGKENSADDLSSDNREKTAEDHAEFERGKLDPKYQTLPYSTKFSATYKGRSPDDPEPNGFPGPHPEVSEAPALTNGASPSCSAPITTCGAITSTTSSAGIGSSMVGVVTRTVHSIPTHPPSRGHASAPTSSTQGPVAPSFKNTVVSATRTLPTLQKSSSLASGEEQKVPGSIPAIQKPTAGLVSHAQSRPTATTQQQSQDVDNVRAFGHTPSSAMLIPSEPSESASSKEDRKEASAEAMKKQKPSLPPKPAVPSKPMPPPRQKGDPMASSTESLNFAGLSNRPQGHSRPQVFRYASQNVILSTYTQPQRQQQSTGTSTSTAENAQIAAQVNSSQTPANISSQAESENSEKLHVFVKRRIEMPPDYMFPADETPPSDLLGKLVREMEQTSSGKELDDVDRSTTNMEELKLTSAKEEKEEPQLQEDKDTQNNNEGTHLEELRMPDGSDSSPGTEESSYDEDNIQYINNNTKEGGSFVIRRHKKGNLKTQKSSRSPRRVSFDPLALLLDASLEGELELVKRTAMEVPNPSAANDEGITALHNAICAGHLDIVTFLVTFGCDVNAQDSDGWTPLHCAASCNNVAMVRFLVEHGACVLATTLSDHETAAEKCEQDEEGYDGCSQYLYSVQEKLGIMNGGVVYAVYDYDAKNDDELTFKCGDTITILRRGDEYEREWWWGRLGDQCGYVPRNLLGLYPRVKSPLKMA